MLTGIQLKRRRVLLDLTTQDIADMMHVSKQTISNIEKGISRYPTLRLYNNIMAEYEDQVQEILKEF